ncbi:MAG: tetratricopeptide repeat protein [Crocinitomicaceae bacterium]|nr:tetratricopeptide repeat protein [Crocinitomicaceae bacterium]
MMKKFLLVFLVGMSMSLNIQAQEDTTKTLEGGQVDQSILDSMNMIDPFALEKYNMGIHEMNKNNFNKAVEWFSEAYKIDSKYKKSLLQRGRAYRQLGQKDKAIADLELYIKEGDSTDIAEYEIGRMHFDDKEWGDAEKRFEAAILKNNKIAKYYYYKGVCRLTEKDLEGAITQFNKTLELDKQYAYAYNDRASAYMRMEKYDDAIRDYRKAVSVDAEFALSYNNMGTAYRRSQKFEDAVKAYSEAIRLSKDNYISLNNRGNAYYSLGQYDKALADFDAALKIKSDYAMALSNKASVYIKWEKWEDAVKFCDDAIKYNEDIMQAYFNRGIAKEMMRDVSGACTDWEKAFILGSEAAEKYLNSPICAE